MKLGICTGIDNIDAVYKAGFDYIELNLTELATQNEQTAAESLEKLRAGGLRSEAMCIMLPGDFRLSGPETNHPAAVEYLKKAFARASGFGLDVQVFGSGGVRKAPEGFSKDTAREQVAEFLRLAARIAAEYKIKIAIEPLNPGECNLINTVSDALALQEQVGESNVGVLADWYHMSLQNETTEAMINAGDRLFHCHIAAPDRKLPLPDDGAYYSEFTAALKKMNYKNRLSIEAWADPEDFEKSLQFVRNAISFL